MPYPGLLHPETLWQATADPHLHERHSDTVLAQSLWVGPEFCAPPRSEQLRWPSARWAPVPGGLCILITSPVLAALFPACTVEAPSQTCYMSPLESWSQAVTLLEDINHPGSQKDLVSSWEPAHSHEIKRHLLPGRKVMANLYRDFTFLTKVCLVKAMSFPVVMYGCWVLSVKKADCWKIDPFKLWCWRRLLRVPWITKRSNPSIVKEISPEYSLQGLMLKLNLQ